MSTYLVTGGAGFIGSNIVEELLKRGEEVRVLDNFSTGKRENIQSILNAFKSNQTNQINLSRRVLQLLYRDQTNQTNSTNRSPVTDNLEIIEGDIRSYHTVREAVDDVDFILHQAALPSVPRSINDPVTTNEVNVSGTLNVLNAALDAKVKRVVYASSSSIYGDSEILPKREDMTPNPLSPYAVSKLAGEQYCRVFFQIYGLETVVLRYFNVFGPRQDPTSQYSAVIPKFIKLMAEGKSPPIYGDGEQSRDFTYVSNVVEANLLAANKKGTAGKVFNIACGMRTTVNNLVEELNKILESSIQATYTKPRPGEVKHSLADIGKARKLLGYNPSVNFQDGLQKTVKWFTQ